MRDSSKGVLAIILACSIWGLSPLFYKLLDDVPAIEILAHRTLFSFLFFAIVLLFQGRIGKLFGLFFTPRTLFILFAASAMIAVNWFLFIWSIQTGRVLQSSLGYFIQPLVAVALGYVFFSERLLKAQQLALVLTFLAVVYLAISIGQPPWVSLTLAITFAIYGLIKKLVREGPVLTVTAEVAVMLPLAVVWLVGAHSLGWNWLSDQPGGAFGRDFSTSVYLALSGLLTAGPLIMFSYAAKRISLASVGIAQYLNPSLQFVCSVLIFSEPFSSVHALTFLVIWIALALYTVSAVRQDAALRRADSISATSSATKM